MKTRIVNISYISNKIPKSFERQVFIFINYFYELRSKKLKVRKHFETKIIKNSMNLQYYYNSF